VFVGLKDDVDTTAEACMERPRREAGVDGGRVFDPRAWLSDYRYGFTPAS
jgi:hypothetical protein